MVSPGILRPVRARMPCGMSLNGFKEDRDSADEPSVREERPLRSVTLNAPRCRGSLTSAQSETSRSAAEAERVEAFREARTVRCLRVLVILILIIAASIITSLSYRYVKENQLNDFKHAYEESVNWLLFGYQNRIDLKVAATRSFSAVFTAHHGLGVHNSSSDTQTWPFVTMPNFQEQVSGLLQISKGRALEFSPIIEATDRSSWEIYAVNKSGIVGASPEQVAQGIYMKDENGTVVSATGNYTGSRYQGLFSPVWQIAPTQTNSKAFLFDLRSQADRRRAVDDMIEFKVPTLTSVLQLVQDSELRPSAILFSPVFSDFDKTEVVGSTLVVFSWDMMFKNILPNNIVGLVVVMSTNTGQEFTFVINGDDVSLMGEGDHHSSQYNKYRVTVQTSLAHAETLVGLDEEAVVRYTLEVYPSYEFESQFVTNAPAAYAGIVGAVFIVTSAAFLLYDFIGQNHRNILVHAATKANSIVNSLFPDTVRDRLFTSNRGMGSSSTTAARKRAYKRRRDTIYEQVSKPAQTMKRFLLPTTNKEEMDRLNVSSIESSPIADLFPEATVMFADIAGFTSWSSERDPEEVFQLLERLFKEFDELATQIGVFKISTIGDCYLAVAGLPDARQDHAEVLAVFASGCQECFGMIVKDLSHSLGPETAELSLRTGLHSGPVTAGVLRGLKPRFEVFGDTVNTASRMESTGEPKRIQVSQQTAELLIEGGKESWLEERGGGVSAKGKGHLQTYWLQIGESSSNGDEQSREQREKKEEDPCTRRNSDTFHASVDTLGTPVTM